MAINPMQAPIDYLGQMGLTPTDPGTALLEGLQLGAVFKQQRQAQEQAVKAEEFNAAASAYYRNPTLQAARDLQANFPEYAAQFNDATKTLTAEQRMNEATYASQILTAIRSGQTETAQSMLGQLSRAAQESGEDSTVWDKMSQLAASAPETAYAVGLQFTTAAYPEEMSKIAKSWEDLGIGGGKPGIKDVDRQPTGLSIITYEDGTQEVKDVYGNVLTGEAAAKAVEAAENRKMQMTEAGVPKPPGGVPEQAFDRDQIKTFFDDVRNVGGQLRNIQRAKNAYKGAIVGVAADARLELARIGQFLFPNNPDIDAALQDTRSLINSAAEAALKSRNLITGDGQGPATEGEQKLLNDYVGGRTQFSPPEWGILLNVIEANVKLNAEDSDYLLRAAAESGSEQAKKYVTALQNLPSMRATQRPPPAAGGAKPPPRELTDEEILDLYGPPRGAQ